MNLPPIPLNAGEFLKLELRGDVLYVGIYDYKRGAWAETEVKISLVEDMPSEAAALIRSDLDHAIAALI